MSAVGANQKVVEQRPGKQAADSPILSTYAPIVGIEYAEFQTKQTKGAA